MKQPAQLPRLKPRQTEILILLHRFRFLSRPQIQVMLGHKTWAKIIIWLNDLTDQHYIHRYYEQKLAGKPAIYCLDKASVRYLRNLAFQDAEAQPAKENPFQISESHLNASTERKPSQTLSVSTVYSWRTCTYPCNVIANSSIAS